MYRGLYINMERNEERRAALERHLAQIGAAERYERFPAVDGRAAAGDHPTRLDSGNLGLWLSLESILASGRASILHLHILEDDAMLASDFLPRCDALLSRADAEMADWDVIFTDRSIPADLETYKIMLGALLEYRSNGRVSLLPLDGIGSFGGTTSYLINRRSIAKLGGLIAGQWAVGAPIDLFLRMQADRGLVRAYFTAPFLSTLSPQSIASDIRGSLDRSRRVWDIFRRAFFVNADEPALLAEMHELTKDAKITRPLHALFLMAQKFQLSDQWQNF